MADHKFNDTFSFGRIRSPTKKEKENRSPAKHETSEVRRGGKQTRVRFADSENTPAATSKTGAADTALTPPVAQPSSEAASETPLGAADLETPVGARNVPTPFGTMGRAALPPTPFAPGSVTPGLNSAAAAQLSSWRSRAANAAFKAKSPPTSRQSSPASSSGMPDNMSPLVTGTSRHSFFSELQSNVLTSSTAASPLTTPGGRSLGRGLDDSPCISGASAGESGRGMSLDSPAIVSGERGAFASPISFPDGPTTSSQPSVRGPLPFSMADLPTEGEGLPIESSSSPTATPTEEAPQPFGSPSVPLPDAALGTQTTTAALPNQTTSVAASLSNWDQLWDEGASDVPDQQAASGSPPAESAGQSATTQQAPSVDQEAVTSAASQQDSASRQVAQSQDDAPQAPQETLQFAELSDQVSASSRQTPGPSSDFSDEASQSARTPAHCARTSSQPQETLPEQASPSLLISSWPDQATTPRPHTSLPDQANPTMPKASAVQGVGAGATPKTAGTKEYGSWWTPPLPKGLTPAWMKVKTPAWVKKMRQLDLENAPVQPVALDLVPLSPYLKPAPLPDLPQVPSTPTRQEQPKKEKSGFAVLCGALLHLVVLLGAAWGSWTSQHNMPMMPLYHQHISREVDATAPYMYSGGFTARPIAATYQYASSMLSRNVAAEEAAPLPSIAEIQQAFHDARQQAPPQVQTEFSHDVVTAMREKFVLDATVEEPDSISSVQQDGSDDEGLPAIAPAQSLSEDDEDAHVEGSSLGDAGSGASWQQDESSGLEASLRHSWGRAASAARAIIRPISIYWQGSEEQPHRQLHAHADQAENTAGLSSHGVDSAYPIVATDAFSRAWREARQQAAGMAGKLTSAIQSAADASASKRALNSLQTVTKGPATALRHSWGVVSHRLSQMRSLGGMSSSDNASSSASSLGGSADSMPPPSVIRSSPADAQGGAKSDPARDLADASADLMQSLDNLLESLENPQADKAKPDASYSDSILAHQAQAQHAEFESEAASGTSSATLVHDGRTEPDSVGLQQHPPRFQGFVDERPGLSTRVHSTAQEGNSRSWSSLLHATKPLIAIVAATTGTALLAQLFFRSHLGNEEVEDLTSPERRRSVSRRLSASFSAMQNAASGEDAVSSVAAASAAVEAAEEAEYSIGLKAVTQVPQSRTPARPRGTAAETEHPRGQYLLRSREVTQVGSHAQQQAIGEVSSKSSVRRSSRHKQ